MRGDKSQTVWGLVGCGEEFGFLFKGKVKSLEVSYMIKRKFFRVIVFRRAVRMSTRVLLIWAGGDGDLE